MQLDKSVQNQKGFVRGVGMTPSDADRRKKRVPVAQIKEQKDKEQTSTLKEFEQMQPSLYEEAKRFAGRFGYPNSETQELMINYIEDAIKEMRRREHEEALLKMYKRRTVQRVES